MNVLCSIDSECAVCIDMHMHNLKYQLPGLKVHYCVLSKVSLLCIYIISNKIIYTLYVERVKKFSYILPKAFYRRYIYTFGIYRT